MSTKTSDGTSRSEAIRAGLDHPVIDGDGHTIEHLPLFLDYLKQVAGAKIADRFFDNLAASREFRWYSLSPAERRDVRLPRPSFWAHPTKNTLDRATCMLPELLRQRLDEFGTDFIVLFPTVMLYNLGHADEELRRAACRASNTMNADLFRAHADRMTPVAAIPTYTPDEAIEELDHAVNTLGLKAAYIASYVRRPVAVAAAGEAAEHAGWIDPLALDSEHDYDPLWAKFQDLGVAVASHSISIGMGTRRSISNFNYNHIGSFATSAEAFCKALFLGGVTRRFPDLKFSFMEGGAGWARNLYSDLVGHWEKRNLDALKNVDPKNLDMDRLADFVEEFGGPLLKERAGEIRQSKDIVQFDARRDDGIIDTSLIDDWAESAIKRPQDIYDRFVPNFYFGCEADDPMTAGAFKTDENPMRAKLKVMYGSDIGHWDVIHMNETLEEAYEMVEDALIGGDDFRDFTFTNAATLHGGMNPDFFKGTVIEDAVNDVLAADPETARDIA